MDAASSLFVAAGVATHSHAWQEVPERCVAAFWWLTAFDSITIADASNAQIACRHAGEVALGVRTLLATVFLLGCGGACHQLCLQSGWVLWVPEIGAEYIRIT